MTDNDDDDGLVLFSGEWLYDEVRQRYFKAYPGLLGSPWSGGEEWFATREVAEMVVADNERERQIHRNMDKIFLTTDSLVQVSWDSREVFTFPFEGGVVRMPSWTWCVVKADEVDRVGGEQADLTAPADADSLDVTGQRFGWPTLTLGEIRRATEGFGDDVPVTGSLGKVDRTPGEAVQVEDYVNLPRITCQGATDGNPVLVLEIANNFDNRQW